MKWKPVEYAYIDSQDLIDYINRTYGLNIFYLTAIYSQFYYETDKYFEGLKAKPIPQFILDDFEFYKREGFFEEEPLIFILEDMIFRGELPTDYIIKIEMEL